MIFKKNLNRVYKYCIVILLEKGNFHVRIYCSTVTRNSTALDAKVVFTDLKNTNLKLVILVIYMAPVVDTQEQSIFQYSSGLGMKRRTSEVATQLFLWKVG